LVFGDNLEGLQHLQQGTDNRICRVQMPELRQRAHTALPALQKGSENIQMRGMRL